MRRALPILVLGALASAGMSCAAGVLVGHEPRTRTEPVPIGATATALAFTQAVLGLQAGATGAVVGIEHTATPDLARAILAEAARTATPVIRSGVVSALGGVLTGAEAATVLVEARIVARDDGTAMAVSWPLALRKRSGTWLVTGVGGRWGD
ncbi:MAG TPA: hypothetical protein VNF50_05295 [Acidimicrobiales bacterium]|nr:hypothetical protein [Acidimicrobiales bacterium]